MGDAALGSAVTALRAFYQSIIDQFPPGNTITADFAVDVETKEDHAVNWTTGTRARRARGRTFLGPMGAATLEANGTVGDGTLTKIRTACTALRDASLVDNGWALSVWGLQTQAPYKYQGKYSDLPHVGRDVVGFKINDQWAVMRSRRPRI